ncbi:MAG TPA: GTPase [Sedimentisphaerales bacterium]|nr:GTPase [Sedimentisphaerales bacterium]
MAEGAGAMPANLTPGYKRAEEAFRSATTHEEKVLALEEMLRVIPRHKGTEGLQAELKRKLSNLREQGAQQRRAGHHVDIFHIPRTGAGQVALIGLPNVGKSSILAALSKAKVHVAEFPFATQAPVPGIVKHEDVQIEVIDMPPITADYAAPGQINTYRNCDIIGIVVDLTSDVLEQMQVCLDYLEGKRLILKPGDTDADSPQQGFKKVLVICTKADIGDKAAVDVLMELYGPRFRYVTISTSTQEGLLQFSSTLFHMLEIIRVYAKPPGKPADMEVPFTLPQGSTVKDMAAHIHRNLASKLKSARAWGAGVYDGQNVCHDHVLHDKDVIELHFG